MIRRILSAALIAGTIGGGGAFLLQASLTTPLILQAEGYESAAQSHEQDHDHASAASPTSSDAAKGGAVTRRMILTALSNIITASGFALLLCAAFALRGRVSVREGLLWGAGGFLMFHLAPALGLPPELPGTPSAPLAARQEWWLLAVSATGAGLALLVFARGTAYKLIAIALLALPHLIGAPHPLFGSPSVPEELIKRFIPAALGTALLFWLLLGVVSAYFFGRFDEEKEAAPTA